MSHTSGKHAFIYVVMRAHAIHTQDEEGDNEQEAENYAYGLRNDKSQ